MSALLAHYRTKPIIQYHTATSGIDIIQNNIKADTRGVYTGVKLFYVDDIEEFAENGMKQTDFDKTLDMYLDDTLRPEDIHMKEYRFFNCQGTDVAYRYGSGLLLDNTRRLYKGEIILQGNPDIEPWDVVFISDATTDMIGAVGVRTVEHIISANSGFISVVTPDVKASANDYVSMPLSEALWVLAEGYDFEIITTSHGTFTSSNWDMNDNAKGSYAGLAGGTAMALNYTGLSIASAGVLQAVLATAGLPVLFTIGWPVLVAGLVFSILSYKLVRWAQHRQPVVMTPLIRSGVPYIYGLDTYRIDGLFSSFADWFMQQDMNMDGFYNTWLSTSDRRMAGLTRLSNNLLTSIENFVIH